MTNHSDFKQDRTLSKRAEDLKSKIRQASIDIEGANFFDSNIQYRLKELFDLEVHRVDGIISGITESQRGGDFRPSFRRGSEAYNMFEQYNAAFKNLIR